MIGTIIVLIILITLSGFFSGIEVAMMAVSDHRVNYLVEKKYNNALALKNLKSNKERLLITILLGNNIVNIGASAFATALAIGIFGKIGVGIATGIMTFILLLFGEITPKAYAVNNAEKIALRFAPVINFLARVLWPFVEFFNFLIKFTSPMIKGNYQRKIITEDEIKNIITISEEDGAINSLEKEMIHNIFKFNDLRVEQIMKPRPDIYAVDGNVKISSVIKDIIKRGYSRIPVYEDEFDKMKGFLYVKDLVNVNFNKKIKDIMKPIMIIPNTKKIDKLFAEMKQTRKHMAIVVDEFGIVAGLITIEDLLEEIVGEIYDETDQVRPIIQKINSNSYTISGNGEIKYINKKLGIKLGGHENETLSGYILKKIGRIPKTGDVINISPKTQAKILQVTNNRILSIRIKKK